MHPIVFIVGCPRSGTSAVLRSLRLGLGYNAFDEGHLAPELLRAANDAIKRLHERAQTRIKNDLIAQRATKPPQYMADVLNPSDLHAHFAEMLRRIYDSLLKAPWCEKTAGAPMLEVLPQIAAAFPEARFIYMHRRMHEVVASHRRKFAGVAPLAAARHWAHCQTLWEQHKPKVAGRFMEIDQREMLLAPFATGLRLQEFLEFDDPALDRLVRWLIDRRRQRTAEDGSTPVTPEDLALPSEQWAEIESISAAGMSAYGYDFGARYRLDDPRTVYLAADRQGVAIGGDLRREGDALVLPARAGGEEGTGWVLIDQIEAGQRLKAVVAVFAEKGLVPPSQKSSGCQLRFKLAAPDQVSAPEWVCDLGRTSGGELAIELPQAHNARLELTWSYVAGGPPAKIEIAGARLESGGTTIQKNARAAFSVRAAPPA